MAPSPLEESELVRRGALRLGVAGFITGLAAVVAQLCLALAIPGYAHPLGAITYLLLAAAAAPLALWGLCRPSSRTARFVRGAEIACVLGSASMYSATLLYFDVQHHFDRLAVLALTFVAILRATLVPSSVLRTLLLTAAMAVPLVTFVGLSYRGYVVQPGDALGRTHTPLVMAGWTVLWWSFTTWLATLISAALASARRTE